MNFKDALAHEARAVFCNTAEFGEEILIDGIPVTAVIKDNHQSPAQITGSLADVPDLGTLLADRTLSLPTGSIPAPVPGQQLCINNEYWLVIKATDNLGMLRLLLQKSWS